MLLLIGDRLEFLFPEVHPQAKLRIDLQRTLRIPDDGKTYPLPPGLGSFPLRHVDHFAEKVPAAWLEHGGVMMPMYQAEALWLHFACEYVHEHDTPYPFAISVAAGETNAVTGDAWSSELHDDPQDYMVAPTQPWLDGYCVKKGLIRQFVAMPLGAGYTAEEQITGAAEHGGIQIVAYPMKREAFERHHPKLSEELLRRARRGVVYDHMTLGATEESRGMGLAPGGTMKQEIYDDRYGLEEWRTDVGHRCFVHLANSMVWRAITGEDPPTTPPTAREYSAMGLPWFDYYAEDATALKGSKVLKKLKSVTQLGKKKGDVPLPENQPVDEMKIVKLREGLKKNQIREGTF